MAILAPQFELTRVYDDETYEVELYPVTELPIDTQMDRRGFLGIAATGLSIAALLATLPTATEAAPRKSSNVKTGCASTFAHKGKVLALAISPDGHTLVSGSSDDTIKLWSLPAGGLKTTLTGNIKEISALTFGADSELLASADGADAIRLWNLEEGQESNKLSGHTHPVGVLASNKTENLLASGSNDGTIKLWSLRTHDVLTTLEGHEKAIQALAISTDGKLLASADEDSTVKLWSLPDGDLLQTTAEQAEAIYALAISPDGTILASGSDDGMIKLWSLPNMQPLQDLRGHKDTVKTLTISPNGRYLVSGAEDNTIRLWELPTGTLVKSIKPHSGSVNALAIRPDGVFLASGSSDKTVKLWNFPSLTPVACLMDLVASPPEAYGITVKHRDTITSKTYLFTLPCGSPIPLGAICTCNCVPGKLVVHKSPKLFNPKKHVIKVKHHTRTGKVYYTTLPCGSPIPAGATCTCNCVPGTFHSALPKPKKRRKPRIKSSSRRGACGERVPAGYICTCNCIPVCQAHRLLHADPVVRTMAEEILFLMGACEFPYMRWAAARAEPALQRRIIDIITSIKQGMVSHTSRWPSISDCIERLSSTDEIVAIMAAQMLNLYSISGMSIQPSIRNKMIQLLGKAAERPWFVRYNVSAIWRK